MRVIIEESEYKDLCDIRDKYYANVFTKQLYISRNDYYCHGWAYSNDEAFNKLADINKELGLENIKLQKELDYYKCRSFWKKFKDLWKN